MYCGYKHRSYHFREGHKRDCQIPPFRKFGRKENALFAEVFGQQDRVIQPQGVAENDISAHDPGDEDDDGSWESIDSDEELEAGTALSTTAIIQRFFDAAIQSTQN
jgi:hypothetical protein